MQIKEIVKSLQKKYELEDGVLAPAMEIIENPKQVIPTSPYLDAALSGGIPEGSFVTIAGPPGAGKTTFALDFAATCQKPEYGGRFIAYLDIEGRIKPMNLQGIPGLDLSEDKFMIIKSVKGNILSAEKNMNIACDLINDIPGLVLIIDSTSALCSSKEQTSEVSGEIRSLGPKILASFCRKAGTTVPVQNAIVLMIQHLIANTSGYGSPYIEDSGNKIKFQSNVKMVAKSFRDWKDGENIIGQIVNWDIIKSALGKPSDRPEMYLRYGYGIDKVWENISIACEIDLIKKRGAWFEVDCLDKPAFKLNGQHRVWNYFRENKEDYQLLLEKIKGSL